ncbi:hypothetical protein AAG570_009688 [Ranatra chinensis]|uniref:Mediator of RNA polymerase II transcription subunit 1 n=1 Tax=Ranatra chinensis TaxID=642074 RepID=A0ABD0ZAW8_9HEMI
MEMLMEKIRSRAGQHKSFAESAKALRMTLLEKRYSMDSVERSQLQKCLDTLQQNIKVTTHQAMVERLESVSRQLGLKFVNGPSVLNLFISSDMFYLEVVLDGNGGVKDVKIHHEGRGEQQSCDELVACLTRRDFSDFTAQLEGLASIYQLNAEKKVKCKAYSALASLETDLATLAALQAGLTKDPAALVHKSSVGIVEKRRGGHPMKLTYFVSPYDLLDPVTRTSKPLSMEGLNVGYSVSVCMESSSAHKLQTTPLITVNRSPNWPVYAPVNSSNSITVAGCFVLQLNKPMPMCLSLVQNIQNLTQCECADLSSPHPLLSLIVQHTSGGQVDSANNRGLFVNVLEQHHCYLMTESRSLDGVLVRSVPFTHPSHVPQIVGLLRQQALFNTIIASCVRPNTKQDIEKMVMFEVTPLTWQHLSISLEHPLEESMATVELDLSDITNVACKVYSTVGENGLATSDYATKVFQRTLSIPVTMRSLIKMWHTHSQRMSGLYNGTSGLGNSGGGTNDGGGGDFDPDLKIKLEPGLSSLVGRQNNFNSGESLSDPAFEHFSSQMDSDISISPAGSLPSIQFSGMSGTLKGKPGKRRKRKSGDLWRSPKRKQMDDCDTSSSDSSTLGTPTSRDTLEIRVPTPSSASGLEFPDLESSSLSEKPQSDLDTEETVQVQDLEDEEILKPKKPKKREEKKSTSDILFDIENKNLVHPSVSITPISSSQINSQSLNSVLGLERRPGIEIIPIGSSPASSLPSSITITPISAKSIPEDRLKSDRKSGKGGKGDDKTRLDKKRKRKREESPMGPPEKVPHKSDPLSKPVSVSIKPADSSASSSPRPPSPGGRSKYTGSPTPHSAATSSSASTVSSIPGKSSPVPGGSSGYPTSSPKNSVPSSPKHGTSSPKHQSSAGKPSMSALKSAAVSSPGKTDSKGKSKDNRDKERNSGGHSSPKMKPSSVKLKQLDLGSVDVPQSLQSGGSTPPSSGDGGKSSSVVRNRKGSLSAVIDKLKSAQHCGEESPAKDKKDISKDKSTSSKKTRTKDSAKVKTSGTGSPKTSSGPKSGVNLVKKSQQQPPLKSGMTLKTGSSSNKSAVKSLSSQKSLKPTGSPKTVDPNRPRDKPRISKSSSDKSIFSSSKSDSKRSSPNPLRDDPSEGFKGLPVGTHLVVEGFMKQLNTKFQIPKLSARNSQQSDDSKKSDKNDSPKVIDLVSKQDLKLISVTKNSEDKSKPSISIGSVSPKLMASKSLDISETPNISIIPVSSLPDKEDKESKGYGGGAVSGVEDVLSSLKMELPISALSFTCDPGSDAKPEDSSKKSSQEKIRSITTSHEDAELLLDFSSSAPQTSEMLTSMVAMTTSIPIHRNTPPPSNPLPPPPPVVLPPPPTFPGSPSVSVHIVKSPAPSPLVMRSPHSTSPVITDDELMDEAVVGIGK